MVGTATYMPPEQAVGGDVTPRSDLYSVGALLYEMLTGRPPFVGEDSVAVISQQLNTRPVAPSWHNSEVRPELEALVLGLLEKTPDARPESAQAVRERIDAILREGPDEAVRTIIEELGHRLAKLERENERLRQAESELGKNLADRGLDRRLREERALRRPLGPGLHARHARARRR